MFSLSQLDQPLLQGPLVPFNKSSYLETNIQALGVLTVIVVSLLLGLPGRQG